MRLGAARDEWTSLSLVGGVVALVAILYADSVRTMAGLWQVSSYAHGPLVLAVSLFLLWRLRGRIAAAAVEPCAWGLAILGALGSVWLMARAVGVQAAEHLAVALLIPAAVLTFLGVSFLRRAAFPLLFLIAAVPIGEALIPVLMQITAEISALFLRSVGVPVFRQGQFMTLPGGVFEIADVCSGLGYLVSGSILALLFSYLSYAENWKRAVFVACAAAGLVLANAIRAFVVMLVASATEMRHFAGRDHVYFGWLFFGLVLVVIFWIGGRFADKQDGGEPAGPGQAAPGAHWLPLAIVAGLVMLATTAGALQQDLGSPWLLLFPATALLLLALRKYVRARGARDAGRAPAYDAYFRLSSIAVVCAGAAILALGPVLSLGTAADSARQVASVELPFVAACSGPTQWSLPWRPSFPSANSLSAGTYDCSGGQVHVSIAAFANDGQAHDMVQDTNRPYPDVWRRYSAMGKETAAGASGRPIRVNEVRAQQGPLGTLLWYWYTVGDRTATGPIGAKLLQAIQWLSGGSYEGRAYVLVTQLAPSLPASRTRLEAIAAEIAAGSTRVSQVAESGER